MDTNLLTFAGVILGLVITAVVIYKKGEVAPVSWTVSASS